MHQTHGYIWNLQHQTPRTQALSFDLLFELGKCVLRWLISLRIYYYDKWPLWKMCGDRIKLLGVSPGTIQAQILPGAILSRLISYKNNLIIKYINIIIIFRAKFRKQQVLLLFKGIFYTDFWNITLGDKVVVQKENWRINLQINGFLKQEAEVRNKMNRTN